MAKIKLLKRRVVAHKWREPGTVVEVGDGMARMLADMDPDSFEWIDRPVQQFVDVVEPPPVAPVNNVEEMGPQAEPEVHQKSRRSRSRKKVEVSDAGESTE